MAHQIVSNLEIIRELANPGADLSVLDQTLLRKLGVS